MENSIEETIKTIEKMIKSYKEADKCGLSNNDFKNEIKALEHILSDYKRVLKENEELKKRIPSFENGTFLGNYDGLVKLQNELDKLQKKYETDTHILQNQLDLANADRIDLAQQNKELRKENEELHREINQRIKLKIENEKIVDTQFIYKPKIKDKIEESENV